MFFSLQKSGPRTYVQIVENRRDSDIVRQHVLATVGRMDELAVNVRLASLLACKRDGVVLLPGLT